MKAGRAVVIVALLVTAGATDSFVQQPAPGQAAEKPDAFSPLGFEDLRAYEQAFPGVPGSVEVARASAARYWVYRGVAYRGAQPAGTAWISLGPSSTTEGGASGSGNFSGRVSALAISPACALHGPCRLWVGTAGGGVWRSDDAMHADDAGWRWIGAGLGTNNIGSLALDPNDESGGTIYVGTGETNSPQNSGAGTGLYRSTDGGDRWARVSTNIVDPAVSPAPIDFTSTRGIGSIAIEPGNPQVIYVATTTAMLGMTAVRGGQSQITGYPQPRVGLYKTENGGASWSLIWVPPLAPAIAPNPHQTVGQGDTMIGVRWVEIDPRNPRIVYASAWNNAIHRSAPPLENGDASFKPVFAIVGRGGFQDLAMFDLTESRGHTRVYAYNGTLAAGTQGLYRLDNADVPAAELVTGSGSNLSNTASWIALSSNDPAQEGSTSRAICASQCFYDLVVAVPPRRPDTVVLGGVATPTFGEPTIRSTDAGVTFSAFSSDAQTPPNRAHVDVRAVAFHPRNPDIAFVGSDGGVVRNDGVFVNIADRCGSLFGNAPQCARMLAAVPRQMYFLNRGLQTLQFYNVALDPRAPLQRLIGGLQDNGTVWQDGTGAAGVWKSVFPFGDGTSASGFHPSRAGVLFASFQSNRFFVNFANGDLARWLRIDDPIRAANERATITASTGRQFLSFDEVNPDTQFTGFQHVWRTKSNGGSQAFLEANCRFSGGSAALICGDWIPLGVAHPFPAGSTPESAGRRPGDLTADAYGSDRTGGVIVAVERSALDAGTLWAATSAGRLFVSKNADAAAGPDVTFSRVDTPVTPNRFVTRIVPDRTDPNAAFISYSGFNALTPSSPGHIFRAVFNPSSRTATFTLLDRDLGDLPVNTIAVDDGRGDLYAATDFGVLVLRRGSPVWELAGVGFPEALVVDLEFVRSERVLVAATHGLGIFYTRLDP
ncbi:MAG TPA: hypothetical protein VFK57_15245 [Vicinamibacterales bacterium]|nr:hypothetical protein [Vicinamibacterales bacterium]